MACSLADICYHKERRRPLRPGRAPRGSDAGSHATGTISPSGASTLPSCKLSAACAVPFWRWARSRAVLRRRGHLSRDGAARRILDLLRASPQSPAVRRVLLPPAESRSCGLASRARHVARIRRAKTRAAMAAARRPSGRAVDPLGIPAVSRTRGPVHLRRPEG